MRAISAPRSQRRPYSPGVLGGPLRASARTRRRRAIGPPREPEVRRAWPTVSRRRLLSTRRQSRLAAWSSWSYIEAICAALVEQPASLSSSA
jgi:hypothetical protein